MDAKQVFNVLNAHREHYRVLPKKARDAINDLMSELVAEPSKPTKRKTTKKAAFKGTLPHPKTKRGTRTAH